MSDNKVVLINYTGRKGSGCLVAIESAKSFMAAGKKVVAVVAKDTENIKQWKKLELEELIAINTYSNGISFIINTLKFYLLGRFKLKKRLREYDIEFSYSPMITLWTDAINSIVKAKKIVVMHDATPHTGEANKIAEFLFNKAYTAADVIMVHSKRFVEEVKNRYKKECHYIPLGQHNVYETLENQIKAIEYEKNKINFVFFGRISEYKGLHYLSKAYESLTKEFDNITLTVAGNGDFSPYEEEYRNLKNCKVVNRWIKDEEVESFFIGDNLVEVLPYTDSSQSGVALVAMNYRIPVIATITGGMQDQITDGYNGLLVNPSDAKSLYEAMKKFVLAPELINNYGENARKYVKSLSWDNSIKTVIDIADGNKNE